MMDSFIIGWIAVLIAAIGFGSYAVPIKGEAANSVAVDPLVMQSYKSFMCFVTSWFVLLNNGQELSFTYWGIVSGLFWVPAGTLYIYAVKNCGIATTQGIVSSSIVTVSFIWGHFIFHEPVQSQMAAYIAVLIVMTGLIGMSYFSSYSSIPQEALVVSRTPNIEGLNETSDYDMHRNKVDPTHSFLNEIENFEIPHIGQITTSQQLSSDRKRKVSDTYDDDTTNGLLPRRKYSHRNLGRVAAFMCGVWGGSCMIPMHYSNDNTHGLGYVISFASGAIIVTILLWLLRFGYNVLVMRSVYTAYMSLPSFHLRVMWLPGTTAGTLWSIGNVGSIVACQRLGQAVGYSASQAALLVSGMWGIFFYKEVTNSSIIVKWFLSAMVTVVGIFLLGYVSVAADAVQGSDDER